MATANDKLEIFNKKGEILFRPALEKYGYTLIEKKTNEINNQVWSIHHIYLNQKAGLKIIIKQEPCYVDYGFSLFIFKLEENESNILYNTPQEEQDIEGTFLNKAHNDIFSSPALVDIIEGKLWKKLNSIPFRMH